MMTSQEFDRPQLVSRYLTGKMDPSVTLILTGGMCNMKTLVSGTPAEIAAEARQLI